MIIDSAGGSTSDRMEVRCMQLLEGVDLNSHAIAHRQLTDSGR